MAHTSTPWSRLAARTARGILARKGVSFDEVAEKISAIGIPESFRGAGSRIQRGTYSLAYFLALLRAVGAECPAQWTEFVDSDESWEAAASHVLLHEIGAQGLSLEQLSHRLEAFGTPVSPERLTAQVESGEFPFTLMLQTALVAPIPEFIRFVDHSDLAEAAGMSSALSTGKADGQQRRHAQLRP
ncbi:conserved hypothetical protein [Cupriavidus taiwanensis]|uniref:DUF6471 domain-containing protein n=1 Tax=Cupriavidus taiwanensis TaxID=164546 RepID=UPI000E11F966|nr:DUF6471 domain-containing protein [Cupriavidus taiwanensis]SOY93249.1 conserved hypothetical protein [Cupriavidus taiwanensis]SOY96505.1 conserved hypothetical protein [Cupriavidus taiwanensis]